MLAVQDRAARAPSYPASGPGGGSNGDHAAQEALVNDHPHENPDKYATLVEVHTVSVLPKASFAVSIAKSFEQVDRTLRPCQPAPAIPLSRIAQSVPLAAGKHRFTTVDSLYSRPPFERRPPSKTTTQHHFSRPTGIGTLSRSDTSEAIPRCETFTLYSSENKS